MYKGFSTYLKEDIGNPAKDYRIIVMSSTPDGGKYQHFRTATYLKKECKSQNIPFFNFEVERGQILWDEKLGTYTCINRKDDKPFKVGPNTLCIVRGNVRHNKAWLDKVSQFERAGCTMCNTRAVLELCNDKYLTYLRLQEKGLTQPKTVLIPNEEDEGIEQAVEALGKPFPVIMKTIEGSEGVGVVKIDDQSALKSFVQLITKQEPTSALLIQEYIEMTEDYRVHVLDGKVIGAMTRGKPKGDFRSNITQGAEGTEVKLTDLEIEQCLLAAKAVDCRWSAVDFIPAKDRKKEPPFILEVNHSPGTKGIETAMAGSKEKGDKTRPIINKIVEHFKSKTFHWPVPMLVGYIEMVGIKPFGLVKAKFDTGNGSIAPSIHATNITVKGNSVTWEHHGKKMTNKITRTISVEKGGLQDYHEDRHAVLLDFEFNGKTYKDYEFLLDDRSNRTSDVLLNRKFMNKMNVMVNPMRKYILTTKFEPKGK